MIQDNQALLFRLLGECLGSCPPRVIFDIGSRDGNESMRFAERYPDARIFAFECHPELLPACRDALAPFRGIELVPRAGSLVHVEVEFVEIYAGQALFPEVREYLEAGGWSFAGFTSYSRYFADAVFLNDRAFGRAALRCAKDVLGTARLIWKYRRHALNRRIPALAGLS